MSGIIATIPKYQFCDENGVPLVGGYLYTYISGTTTPSTTYKDKDLSIANTNPIVLDARGECLLWIDQEKLYTFVLKNKLGVTIWTVDNISHIADYTINVDSIDALRNITKNTTSSVNVLGYYAAGDGGGGEYWYDSSDTTSADNGGTIIVAADGGRWKLIVKVPVSQSNFGAKVDGTTDDTSAINSTIAAVNSIILNDGASKVTSTINFGKSLVKGWMDSTIKGAGVTFSGSSGADIYNFSASDFRIAGTGSSGATGLSSNYAHKGLYTNINIDGFSQAAVFDNCYLNTFVNLYQAVNATGVTLQNDTNACAFIGSSFNNSTDTVSGFGCKIKSSYANVFVGCDFEYNAQGLVLDNTVGTGAVNQTNTALACYFEGNTNMAVGIGMNDSDVSAEAARIIAPSIISIPGGVTQGIYVNKSNRALIWYPYFGGGSFIYAKINLTANSKNTNIIPFRPSEIVAAAGATVSINTIQSNLVTVTLDGSGNGFADVAFTVPYATDDLSLPPVSIQYYETTDVLTAPVGTWRVNSMTTSGFRLRVIGGTASATYKFFWRAGV